MTMKGALRSTRPRKSNVSGLRECLRKENMCLLKVFLDFNKSFWRHGVLNFLGGSMANEHVKGRTFRRDLERFGMALSSTQVIPSKCQQIYLLYSSG